MSELDPEFDALNECVAMLERLSAEARVRVLDYLVARYRPKPSLSPPTFRGISNPTREQLASLSLRDNEP